MREVLNISETCSHQTSIANQGFDMQGYDTQILKKSVIQVDLSTKGIGAALIQEGNSIEFSSKSLKETERHYTNIECELFAVIFGREKFRTYIYSYIFRVESDHKPLEIISFKNLTAEPHNLQRMLLHLQGCDMSIMYHPY